MSVLSACILTCNELGPLQRCLSTLKNKVDQYVIGVDSKTTDDTFNWLLNHGYEPFYFTFDNFSQARNLCVERVKTPWYFVIDSDEIILEADAGKLRDLCWEGHKQGIDAWAMQRRHWFDLEMTKEWVPHANPDVHLRVVKNYVRFSGLVHEGFVNYHKFQGTDIQIHHFNQYYRSPEGWVKRNAFYKQLQERSQ